tara:strand:+ start:4221 stop:4394 length:174 start_codon:yes stop_codon:yes gene_type:complete
MAKKARLNPTKQPFLAKISKKTGRSSGLLVDGLYGQKVTPKVLKAQEKNRELRNNKR